MEQSQGEDPSRVAVGFFIEGALSQGHEAEFAERMKQLSKESLAALLWHLPFRHGACIACFQGVTVIATEHGFEAHHATGARPMSAHELACYLKKFDVLPDASALLPLGA